MAIIFGEDASGTRVALPVEPSEKCCIAGVSGSGNRTSRGAWLSSCWWREPAW